MKLKQAITTTSVTRNRNCTPYRHGPSSQTHKRPNFLKRWSKRLAWRTRASWGVVSNSSVTRCHTRTARIHVILLWSSNRIVASQITTWRIWCCTTLPRHISTPDGLTEHGGHLPLFNHTQVAWVSRNLASQSSNLHIISLLRAKCLEANCWNPSLMNLALDLDSPRRILKAGRIWSFLFFSPPLLLSQHAYCKSQIHKICYINEVNPINNPTFWNLWKPFLLIFCLVGRTTLPVKLLCNSNRDSICLMLKPSENPQIKTVPHPFNINLLTV